MLNKPNIYAQCAVKIGNLKNRRNNNWLNMKYLILTFILILLCNQTYGQCKDDNSSSVSDDLRYEFSDEIVKSEVIVKFKGFYTVEARKNYISG